MNCEKMEKFHDFKGDVMSQVDQISEIKINELSQMWLEIFDPEICVDHMSKLVGHVEAFYSDIIRETKIRKSAIQEQIKKLQQEKADLKRLLKEDVSDVSSNGIPLYTLQMQIDESLSSLREKLETRRSQIVEFLLEQEQLCEDMAETPRPLVDDPLPSESEILDFQVYLSSLNEEKSRRVEEISNIRRNIKTLLEYLDIQMLDEYDDALVNDRLLRPTIDNIGKLQLLHDQFAQQFQEMKEQIDFKRKKIESLWSYLSIDPGQQRKFAKYNDYTQITYSILSQELDRCEQIKRENIKQIIEKVREEIAKYWDLCLWSDKQKTRFVAFTSTVFTEDLLALHEMELDELKIFYEENSNIFELILERNDLWSKMKTLEDKANDPNRYNNRGGQLLKEEKERKLISTKLPKIESRLLELVNNFDATHKRPFTIHGDKVKDIIDRDWEQKRQEKLTKSTKKVVSTPSRTPMHSIRTPRTNDTTKSSLLKNSAVRKQLQLPSMSASKMSATSSTVSSSASIVTANGKRRLPPPSSVPRAKRTLIEAFNSPATRMKTKKTSACASKVVPSASNRRHSLKRLSKSRKSMESRKKKFQFKMPAPMVAPAITLTNPEDSTVLSDSTSYEVFENFMSENHSNRSSVLHKPKSTLDVPHHAYGAPMYKKATPKNTRQALQLHNEQTPPQPSRAERATTPNSSSKKMTTKEMPIFF